MIRRGIHFSLQAVLLALLVWTSGAAAQDGTVPVFETGVEPGQWVTVPGGPFAYGLHEHQVTVDTFEIMVTPVTNGEYAAYLNEALTAGTIRVEAGQVLGPYPGDPFHGYEHEEPIEAGWYLHMPLDLEPCRIRFDGARFQVVPGYENHPVTMVTWFGAKAYADFHGWRLPTEHEWEKAARGTDARPFPWGHTFDKARANGLNSGDPFEAGVGTLGNTTPVGFYNGRTYAGYTTRDSRSPYGLYDMAGNVYEWTGDVYVGQHYRYLRGGCKTSRHPDLRVWHRNNGRPDYASPNVGFRCARDPVSEAGGEAW